ncbi:dihydrolipoamide acetyltransferase component of pyruvate dehydrogenase complex [mine drainage metagenome]|uniref:Dihydrolipoamide acetyltransferase component of pyruvate dehydrogenase complex n=1 Tax=mine drainage metagenome TaxID=410659 RepID=T1BAJ4_9ZZZZ
MKELKFVDVGEGITEGHIQKWLVEDGSAVKEDQPVVQIETDKAVVNIPAPISGSIKIIANKDADVKVGDTLAYFGSADELKAAPSAKEVQPVQRKDAKEQVKPNEAAIAPGARAKEVLATPAVRKLARDLGVDMSQVIGTGPNGRIVENDVRAFASKKGGAPIPKFSEAKEESHKGEIERIPMSQVRKAIAKNMELSWTIPRAVHMDLIDATHLFGIVEKEKQKMQNAGTKLTFLPFIIKATIEALKENPKFNSSYDKERQEVIVKKYYNIGLAAEADDGLRVAVVKGADRMSIVEIANMIEELGKRVKDKSISIDEMTDTSFTITNIGSLGGGYLSVPMINYPDVAILGVHLIRDMPVVKDGKIVIGKVLPFSLTFDHRVVDGAEAVKFGNAIKGYIEDPEFLEML